MRYVGIDLAWGTRRPSGLAVLDGGGRLLDVTAALTDEEILAWARPHCAGPCLVALDAPIVVRNETGQRTAEALLNRRFASFAAGAHPSNRTRPHFRDGTRAQALLDRLGVDHLDPSAQRRAIEVYPHPATVTLFGLDRILPYKHKPGRDLASLRDALLTLVGHVASLATADPPLDTERCPGWRRLVAGIAAAERKAPLRRAEDQVDAVLCAYVGRYADARPDDVWTFGDPADGAIVVPVDERTRPRSDP